MANHPAKGDTEYMAGYDHTCSYAGLNFLPAWLLVTHSPTKINMQIYQNNLQLSVESSVLHHVGMTTKVLATVHEDKPDNHFNDGKCDSQS